MEAMEDVAAMADAAAAAKATMKTARLRPPEEEGRLAQSVVV